MILKSFGCSFVYGTDLADDPQGFKVNPASQLTWPALLAKHHGYQYQCHASPGSGNLRIAELVINELSKMDTAVYVVSWSWIDRFDYKNPTNDCWQTVMPTDANKQSEFYYKQFHSQYRDKLTTLINIKTVLDALTAAKVKFVMTHMDPLIFETQWHCTPAVSYLQSSVQQSMTDFEGQTFLEFSRKHNFPISKAWHPLELAHRAGFEVISKSHSFL